MKLMKHYMVACLLLLGAQSCQTKTEPIPDEPIAFQKPAHFPETHYNLEGNPITPAGFALGKALFYDGLLSRDGSISCGSCHQQVAAFAHQDHDVSHGIDGLLGTRNSPALMNLAWSKSFFWDGGVPHLDLFSIAPIENPVEMDEKMGNVLQKLQNSPIYPAMFEKAFGNKEINTAKTMKALSQFMLMLVSANSKYDKMKRGEASFTAEENAGMTIFQAKCATCHAGEIFTDNSFANNGLPLRPILPDEGRYLVTGVPTDKFRFKVPSLRNIEKTAPYMHDGRIATLPQVIAHYNNPALTPNADARMFQKPAGALGIPLTIDEQAKLLTFLKTLTDEDFLKNRLFSE
jgi:cytochrome c peroxidase